MSVMLSRHIHRYLEEQASLFTKYNELLRKAESNFEKPLLQALETLHSFDLLCYSHDALKIYHDLCLAKWDSDYRNMIDDLYLIRERVIKKLPVKELCELVPELPALRRQLMENAKLGANLTDRLVKGNTDLVVLGRELLDANIPSSLVTPGTTDTVHTRDGKSPDKAENGAESRGESAQQIVPEASATLHKEDVTSSSGKSDQTLAIATSSATTTKPPAEHPKISMRASSDDTVSAPLQSTLSSDLQSAKGTGSQGRVPEPTPPDSNVLTSFSISTSSAPSQNASLHQGSNASFAILSSSHLDGAKGSDPKRTSGDTPTPVKERPATQPDIVSSFMPTTPLAAAKETTEDPSLIPINEGRTSQNSLGSLGFPSRPHLPTKLASASPSLRSSQSKESPSKSVSFASSTRIEFVEKTTPSKRSSQSSLSSRKRLHVDTFVGSKDDIFRGIKSWTSAHTLCVFEAVSGLELESLACEAIQQAMKARFNVDLPYNAARTLRSHYGLDPRTMAKYQYYIQVFHLEASRIYDARSSYVTMPWMELAHAFQRRSNMAIPEWEVKGRFSLFVLHRHTFGRSGESPFAYNTLRETLKNKSSPKSSQSEVSALPVGVWTPRMLEYLIDAQLKIPPNATNRSVIISHYIRLKSNITISKEEIESRLKWRDVLLALQAARNGGASPLSSNRLASGTNSAQTTPLRTPRASQNVNAPSSLSTPTRASKVGAAPETLSAGLHRVNLPEEDAMEITEVRKQVDVEVVGKEHAATGVDVEMEDPQSEKERRKSMVEKERNQQSQELKQGFPELLQEKAKQKEKEREQTSNQGQSMREENKHATATDSQEFLHKPKEIAGSKEQAFLPTSQESPRTSVASNKASKPIEPTSETPTKHGSPNKPSPTNEAPSDSAKQATASRADSNSLHENKAASEIAPITSIMDKILAKMLHEIGPDSQYQQQLQNVSLTADWDFARLKSILSTIDLILNIPSNTTELHEILCLRSPQKIIMLRLVREFKTKFLEQELRAQLIKMKEAGVFKGKSKRIAKAITREN